MYSGVYCVRQVIRPECSRGPELGGIYFYFYYQLYLRKPYMVVRRNVAHSHTVGSAGSESCSVCVCVYVCVCVVFIWSGLIWSELGPTVARWISELALSVL